MSTNTNGRDNVPDMYKPEAHRNHPDIRQVMGESVMESCNLAMNEINAMGLTAFEAGKALQQECDSFRDEFTQRALDLKDRVAKFLDDVITVRDEARKTKDTILDRHLDVFPIIKNGG